MKFRKPIQIHSVTQWMGLLAKLWIGIWVLTALLANLIATSKPLRMQWNGETVYPAFTYWFGLEIPGEWVQMDWQHFEAPDAIKAPIPYDPGDLDFNGKGDFSKHILGTDELGRDLFSRIIHGSRTALFTGIGAVLLALVIGLTLGGLSGYWGDYRLRISWAGLILLGPAIILAWFYGFQLRMEALVQGLQQGVLSFIGQLLLSFLLFGVILYLFTIGSRLLQFIPVLRKTRSVWLDILISRVIEVKQSIPTLFLILAVAAITEPDAGMTAFWIGITSWPTIARFVRGELLRVREEAYIQAAQGLGYSGIRVFAFHALPNALAPVWALLSFSIAGAILAEASLSFIREPADVVSWGNLLSAARKDLSAWWMALWPGLALFLTLFSLNILGEQLRDFFDPKSNIHLRGRQSKA